VCMQKPSLCMDNLPKFNSLPLYKKATIESKRRGREEPPNQLYEQQWVAAKGEICRWVQSHCRCIVYRNSETALPVHQCRFRSTISLFFVFQICLEYSLHSMSATGYWSMGLTACVIIYICGQFHELKFSHQLLLDLSSA
jgi:hypothetical protein